MLNIKTVMLGLVYLQGSGLEQKEEWELKVWLEILNEEGNHISESEKIHMTQEEFVNACKFLAAKHKSFFPGDNLSALILDRVGERRKELIRLARKEREDQKELEEKTYRRKMLEEHRQNKGEFSGFGKVNFKEIVNERHIRNQRSEVHAEEACGRRSVARFVGRRGALGNRLWGWWGIIRLGRGCAGSGPIPPNLRGLPRSERGGYAASG